MLKILTVLVIIAAVLLIGIMLWDSNRFVRVDYRIESDRIKRPARIVLLADLHNKEYGKQNEKLLAAIEKAGPDMILVAGDLMTSSKDSESKPAIDLINALAGRYPVYYANGNHEYRVFHQPEEYGKTGAHYLHAIRKSGICHLEDGNVYLPAYNIRIYGLDLPVSLFKKFKEPKLESRELKKRLGKADRSAYSILLAHNPVWFPDYAAWGADLTLSGHVHGGVVRLPFLGGVLSTSFRFFPKYDGGAFAQDGKRMIISRGLGAHTIPVRLFNPAELVVIELVPEEK